LLIFAGTIFAILQVLALATQIDQHPGPRARRRGESSLDMRLFELTVRPS
jgi:hypothetical protein